MDNILVTIGPVKIYWYSVCILVGIIIASLIIKQEMKKQNIDREFFINLAFYTIIFGLIGARLYYCAFNLDYYLKNPIEILEIWNGGLAIHGGLLFGAITVIIYSKKYDLKVLKVLDIIVVGLIIGQAIGRWGNFFNKEAFGPVTTLANLQSMHLPDFIIKGMNIAGSYHIPTFLYESMWCLLGFIVLILIRKFYKRLKIGMLSGLYLIWYSVERFIVEGMRTDSLMLGNIKVAQLVSVILILVGLYLIFFYKRKSNHFENLYNEQEKIPDSIQPNM